MPHALLAKEFAFDRPHYFLYLHGSMGTQITDKISASHILVQHEYEASDLLAKLKIGESFEKLAEDFSTCPSGKRGGALGEFGRGRMVESFEEAAFGLKVGEVSGIVKTQFGHHLIKRTK